MTTTTTSHDTFTIERTYPHPPAKVFAAFSNAESKRKWFAGPEDWGTSKLDLDFRVGGHERLIVSPPNKPAHKYNATYQDIVPNERIITTYEMHIGDARISVSLATFEFRAANDGKGTHMKLTEQGAFLDGYDDNGSRHRGTEELLEKLAKALAI